MFRFVVASFLFRSINTLNRCEKKRYESLVTAIPNLSLNNTSLNQGKNLRRVLEDSPLKEKKVVVWNDVANKNISSHKTNLYSLSRGADKLFEVEEAAEGKDRQTCLVSYSAQECSFFPQQNVYSPRANKTTWSSSKNI